MIFDPYESDNGSNRSGFEDLKSGIQPIEISKVEFTEILCTPEEDKKGTNFSFFCRNVELSYIRLRQT